MQPPATTQTVIYRSKRHHTTKRNFEIFKATDFLAAVIDHVPPKSKHTVRYYGVYSTCIIDIPPPPRPPFDIETFEPIEPPWQAIKEWIPDDEPDLTWFNQSRKPSEPDPDWFDQSPAWKPSEVPLGDGRILVLEYT